MTLDPCTACQAPAAWTCAACGPKCPDHVRRVKGPRLRYRCTECGKDAELGRKRRSELYRFQDRLLLAATGPVSHPRVLVATLVCAAILWTITFLSVIGLVLGIFAITVLGMHLVKLTAEAEPYDWPAPSQAMDDVAMPFARALAATIVPILAVFVGVYVMVVKPYDVKVEHEHSLAITLAMSPAFWLAALIAVATGPMMLLRAVTTTEWGPLLNPVAAMLPVRKFLKEYGWICLFAGAGFLATFGLRWLLPRGFIGNFAAALVASYASFATFRLLGEFLWLNPEDFNWGAADEGWVDLDDADRPQIEDLAPAKPLASVAASQSLDAQVNAVLDNRDAKTAVRLIKETPDSDAQLQPATLLRAGQAAASVDELAVALTTLMAAARTDTPEAGKALVIAARILDERMRDQDGAKRLYTQVTQRFPGTSAAQFAGKQLADPRFFLSKKA